VAVTAAVGANATVVVFNGQDDGAPLGGPFTNSNAAEAAFLLAASAQGPVTTETFESKAVGYYSPIAIANGTITYATTNIGNGFSGVSNTTFGNLYGFNVTPGGTNWFGFPDFLASQATFTFAKPVKAFGFYTTGVQTEFTASIEVIQLDGSSATYSLPLNTAGGTSYFGFIDSTPFTTVKIVQANQPGFGDAWGIDDVSYAMVPEPAAWATMIFGLGLVGAAARRRRGAIVTA
jgi:hypothetical protein